MRSSILELLRNATGYISGEEIAKKMNVSRTAIWKHIRELKQAGYAIESHSRSGYSLVKTPDLLLPNEIKSVLKTKRLGKRIQHFDDLVSTNIEAKQLAANGAEEGTIVVSEAQNGGRGRLSRGWYSPAHKGIWFSIILRPALLPQDAPKCTLMAAVAITKAINKVTGVKCGIKWPNDILYDGKKLVGILTEMNAEMEGINYIVIGTGINVNIAKDEVPEELKDIVVSLSQITGERVDRLDLLAEVLVQLEEIYDEALANGFEKILEEWRKCSITLGQEVNVIGIDKTFDGLAMDIDAEGALLVKTETEVKRVLAGDVSIRPKI
ncbi:MAG: BirA bifunctional protein biotin operon repressor and biotin/acetyl-CoA-carboxylase ligase [Massilibacillus sp.]|jgi:BirA family biotin operon repressor/biotin-[acetyl-CoA-carboxylase] ligase|nr:BirA bifunctional protein biotin operon repressor and biotin/acetyl-CoA-carboxylase ligase [Massilibacillus sp.]